MLDDFEYTVNTKPEKLVVRGMQVGYFALRRSMPEEYLETRRGNFVRVRAWCLDHWPSGEVAISSDDPTKLLMVADDLSRFYENAEPSSTDAAEAQRQIGQGPLCWMNEVAAKRCSVGYRQWRCS